MRVLVALCILFLMLASAAEAAIVVTQVSPNVGPSTGGTEVRIEGSGFFGSCTGAPCQERSLTFGGVPASAFEILSDSLLVATTPSVRDSRFMSPVVGTIRVGSEEGSFTFYYSDLQPAPVLDDFERVLLPAYNCYLQGAHGSEWCSTLTAFNSGDESVVVYPVYPGNDGSEIAALALPPSRFVEISLLRAIAGSFTETAPISARVLYVDPEQADGLHLNLRLFDRSRTLMTWGTEVPVVREKDLFEDTIRLFPIPLADRFRATLRIYDPSRTPGAAVTVQFLSTTTGDLLATRVLNLDVLTRQINATDLDVSYPGIAEIGNITELPELLDLGSGGSVRIEVSPLSPGLRFWAMVSVTNDETQHVTLLTPTAASHQSDGMAEQKSQTLVR